MRGDRPSCAATSRAQNTASPHARGSTLGDLEESKNRTGFPACAGIDLQPQKDGVSTQRLPRMRGDRPVVVQLGRPDAEASPHARGSTYSFLMGRSE